MYIFYWTTMNETGKISYGSMEDLEALLCELQNTTANLKKTNLSGKYSYSHQQQEDNPRRTEEKALSEPLKASFTIMASSTTASRFHNIDLQDLEQLLEDYTSQRGKQKAAASSTSRPTVQSLLGELDTAVANGAESRTSSMSPVAGQQVKEETPDKLMNTTTITVSMMKVTHDGLKDTIGGNSTPTPSTRSDAGGDQLDSMLGRLQDNLSKQGITTIPKGDCAACNKTIVGQVVMALGKLWHPEHFTCSHCEQELAQQNFFERSGRAYCENDYHNLFSPRCGYCNGPIKDKCVTALEQTWHPEHFLCAQCGKEFGEEGFHEKDGRAYCRLDYLATFAPHCNGCHNAITDKYITALSTQWHPECFVCQECKHRFSDGCGSYFDHDVYPYCETHYHEKRGSLCAGCHKPINGRCVTAMGKKFHPDHFVCSFCLHQLNKGTFKEHQDKPYCHKCFDKLFH